jgi:hypothetical protein
MFSIKNYKNPGEFKKSLLNDEFSSIISGTLIIFRPFFISLNLTLQLGQKFFILAHFSIHFKQNIWLHPFIFDKYFIYIYSVQIEHWFTIFS